MPPDDRSDAASPETGVVTGTHTATAPAPAADLFGVPAAGPLDLVEGKPAGSRAGRPNKLSRIMAAKVQDEHGTTVLEELVRMGHDQRGGARPGGDRLREGHRQEHGQAR